MDQNIETRFLNVDLDLAVSPNLETLLVDLDPHVVILGRTEDYVSLELGCEYPSLEATLHGFLQIIVSLKPTARAAWEQCQAKTFNVGIQTGVAPYAAEFSLSASTVAAISAVGAALTITVYADRARQV